MKGPRNTRLLASVLAVGVLLMALKFLAWRITHSNTLLSDALESIVNVVAGAFALYSVWLAAKPRDEGHPYGHGKVEFISAGFEGGLVVLAGGIIIWRAVEALWDPPVIHQLGTGILLAAIAGAANLLLGLYLRNRSRKVRSITMEASATHLLSDVWSTAAMIAGLVVIHYTDILWMDQVFAIAFALYIMVSGLRIFRRSVAGIMDEADLDLAARVIDTLEKNRRPQWVDVHNFRMIQYGSILHIDCHVTLPWYYDLEKAHHEIADIEQLVNEHHDQRVELFIHMDPCIPPSCAICSLNDCPERKHDPIRTIPWNLKSTLTNRKHAL